MILDIILLLYMYTQKTCTHTNVCTYTHAENIHTQMHTTYISIHTLGKIEINKWNKITYGTEPTQ